MIISPDTDLTTEPKTLEEALVLINQLRAIVVQLTAALDQKDAAIRDLRKDSSNSSQAPSQDKPERERKYPKRETSSKTQGGQKGHKSTALEQVEDPEEVVVHELEPCGVCDAEDVKDLEPIIRQEWDVKVVRHVTEHRAQRRECKCGRRIADFPTGVDSHVVWGWTVRTQTLQALHLSGVPVRVAQDLTQAAYGTGPYAATITAWSSKLAQKLRGDFDKACVASLNNSAVVHADETPLNVEKYPNAYAHVAVSDKVARFHLGGRAKKDITAGGVIGKNNGRLVSDRLVSYWSTHKGNHQICLSHIIRELTFFDQALAPNKEGTPHPVPEIKDISNLLSRGIHEANKARESGNNPPGSSNYTQQLTTLTNKATPTLHTMQGKTVKDVQRLLRALDKHNDKGEVWAFMDDLDTPPTNNAAERALRPLKVRQRRSGVFRTRSGANDHLTILGYIQTAGRNKVTAREALALALSGNPVLPGA